LFHRSSKRAARKPPSRLRSTIQRRALAADQGPPVQPNKASSTDERLPDLRTIVAATTLQSLARESLLASSARRQTSAYASSPKGCSLTGEGPPLKGGLFRYLAWVAQPPPSQAGVGRLNSCGSPRAPLLRQGRQRTTLSTIASRGNVVLFCGLGNHVDLRGLRGGAEGIRTSDLGGAGARSPEGDAASGSARLNGEGTPPHRRLLPPTLCFPPVGPSDLSRRPRRGHDDRPLHCI
jgi:hypothetical protein